MVRISLVLKTSLLAVAGSLLATGCVVRERRDYPPPLPPVTYAPPPPVVVPPPPAPAPQVVLAPGEVVVQAEPPAPYVEVIPRERPGFAWVPGEWVWRRGWVWNRGHWERPPRPGANWAKGRYEVRGGVRVYVAGGWR
jgi:hypothetical protein